MKNIASLCNYFNNFKIKIVKVISYNNNLLSLDNRNNNYSRIKFKTKFIMIINKITKITNNSNSNNHSNSKWGKKINKNNKSHKIKAFLKINKTSPIKFHNSLAQDLHQWLIRDKLCILIDQLAKKIFYFLTIVVMVIMVVMNRTNFNSKNNQKKIYLKFLFKNRKNLKNQILWKMNIYNTRNYNKNWTN